MDKLSHTNECVKIGRSKISDFNEHVGTLINKHKGIHGGQGWGIRNKLGERLLELVDSFDKVVGNIFFKKHSEKLITFKFKDNSSVINCVVVKKEVMKRVKLKMWKLYIVKMLLTAQALCYGFGIRK